MQPLTVKLNRNANFAVVLAKQTKYGPAAVTYVNLKQANTKQAELQAAGVNCFVIGNRPFYIRIKEG